VTVEGCLCVAELLSAAGEKSRLRSKPLNECNGLFTAVMRSCPSRLRRDLERRTTVARAARAGTAVLSSATISIWYVDNALSKMILARHNADKKSEN